MTKHRGGSTGPNHDISTNLDSLGNLTLRQIFFLFVKTKRISIPVITLLLSLSGVSLRLGTQDITVIALDQLFHMQIKSDDIERQFEDLILTADDDFPAPDGKVALRMRQYKNPFKIDQIGTILANKKSESRFNKIIGIIATNIPSSFSPIRATFAQQKFDWKGHKNNKRYTEKLVKKDTIQRFYNDGCILEYKLDQKGSSIPSTFRWIKC